MARTPIFLAGLAALPGLMAQPVAAQQINEQFTRISCPIGNGSSQTFNAYRLVTVDRGNAVFEPITSDWSVSVRGKRYVCTQLLASCCQVATGAPGPELVDPWSSGGGTAEEPPKRKKKKPRNTPNNPPDNDPEDNPQQEPPDDNPVVR